MSFSIGIVGLPNVGKSSLFKALTKKQVDIADYPFSTINPNVGVVSVPDARLEKIATITKSHKTTPAQVEFVDIAGLVRGAHQGEGLGNQFLARIREVDAICHIVRIFDDPKVKHVEDSINPKRDIDTVNFELIMADLETVKKRLSSIEKRAYTLQDKELLSEVKILNKLLGFLQSYKLASELELREDEKDAVKPLNLLTEKPVIQVFNVSESEMNRVPKEFQNSGTNVLLSLKLESELADLNREEAQEYLKEFGMEESGLDRLIEAAYEILDLITFFTTNENETHAWDLRRNTPVIKAAEKVHTDFAEKFVRAEVVHWKHFVECSGASSATAKGLLHIEGRDYLVQDGDVVYFRI